MDGWEPTTVYAHDDDGRVVSSTPEAEWSEQDVAWILALAHLRAEEKAYRCPSCGGDQRECCSPGAEGAYEVPPPTRCHVTTALLVEQRKDGDRPTPEALLWRVRRH